MSRSLIAVCLFLSLLHLSGVYASTDNTSTNKRLECDYNCKSQIKKLKQYARNGSPHAQTLLGLSYKSGELMDIIDPDSAWKWMKRAKNQKYPPALYYISQWYRNGYHTEVDAVRANKYLEQSVAKKFSPALFDRGILYIQQNNHDEGMDLIKQAASEGHQKAKQLLMSIKNQTRTTIATKVQDTGNNAATDSERKIHPDDEVLTIIGDKDSPIQLFTNTLEDIKQQKLFNSRGRTGTRLGYSKCGTPGSGCKVFIIDGTRTLNDILN